MPDITQDVKYLIEEYDPENRLYSIVHFNQAVAKYAHGWREDAEILQRDGTVMKVMSRPRVSDDTPAPVLVDNVPETPQLRPALPEGWEIVEDAAPAEELPTLGFLRLLVNRFAGVRRG